MVEELVIDLGLADTKPYTKIVIDKNNKVLLYSTGKYIQYLITYSGKQSGKGYVYINMYPNK